MSGPCRACGRPLDDCGTCVCATFPGPRPAPAAWSFVTKHEADELRAALHLLRAAEAIDGAGPGPHATPRAYAALVAYQATAATLANVVEELLVALLQRRPRPDEAHEDVVLHLGGARAARGPVVELACVCKAPGCGTSFAWHPGLHESRSYCYFHSHPNRTPPKEPSA